VQYGKTATAYDNINDKELYDHVPVPKLETIMQFEKPMGKYSPVRFSCKNNSGVKVPTIYCGNKAHTIYDLIKKKIQSNYFVQNPNKKFKKPRVRGSKKKGEIEFDDSKLDETASQPPMKQPSWDADCVYTGNNVGEKLLNEHLPVTVSYQNNGIFEFRGSGTWHASCPAGFLRQFLDNKQGCLLIHIPNGYTSGKMKLVSPTEVSKVLEDETQGFADQEFYFKHFQKNRMPDAIKALFDKSTIPLREHEQRVSNIVMSHPYVPSDEPSTPEKKALLARVIFCKNP